MCVSFTLWKSRIRATTVVSNQQIEVESKRTHGISTKNVPIGLLHARCSAMEQK